ncbi:beta-1,3-galactosyltransferase 1-like [Plakobranchus ocellatus]|uniref:Hexosyltransferase n=1 Tax=Plakobranchus ocellatus TaxID=259542 RepID=A0AAV3XZ72_9GAST|nr:beta-1,3-galactosyltransferase 1-like [Plakobranchus ocellatus]
MSSKNSFSRIFRLFVKSSDPFILEDTKVSAQEVFEVLSSPVTNPHNYKFLSLPTLACAGKLVITVASAPLNYRNRLAIRNTWGRLGKFLSRTSQSNHNAKFVNDNKDKTYYNYTVVFFVAGVANDQLRSLLLKESHMYRDMVISSFMDTYNNLSLKTVAMLKWASTFCPKFGMFLVKCDDDSYVNVPVMLKALQDADALPHENFGRHFVAGFSLFNQQPFRNRESKWYVSFEEYRGYVYPTAVSGSAYGMRIDTARLLYQVGLIPDI